MISTHEKKLKLIRNNNSQEENKSLGEIINWLNDDILKVNSIILNKMTSKVPLISQLSGYIISSGGKRIRPLLTLATSRLCKYKSLSEF